MAKKTEEKKEEKDIKGVVAEKDEFSEWYLDVVVKAGLVDYAPIRGFMVIRPNAYAMWESLQNYFNKVLKREGVKNAYFPLLIPESFFKREAQHAEGFAPELAFIANSEEGERLALRPTSETIMYDSYSKWIRSWRDLPLKLNQWCNVIRWEVKQTKPFLRTREFLWQEGHCAFEKEEDAFEDMHKMINEYQKMIKELLAIDTIIGRKSEAEKFPGAKTTMTVEALMPDGKALQCGTSHNLGQGFAKSFNITFKDRNEKDAFVWQTSWGFSTRLIGALVMVHGDNKGLVIPPRIAPNKVVIVPIFTEKNKEKVLAAAKHIEKSLGKFDAILDDREEYRPGFKFNEWELKGIPVRVEIGAKEIEKEEAVLFRRDNGKKSSVKLRDMVKEIDMILEKMHNDMYEKSKKFLESHIDSARTMAELIKKLEEKKIVKVYMKNDKEVEAMVKYKTGGANSRMIETVEKKGKCIYSGEEVNTIAYIAKSY